MKTSDGMTLDFLTLSDEDKRALATFLRVTDRLRTSDLFKGGLYELDLHIHGDSRTGKLEVQLARPPEKDVRDSLYDIRMFLAESECTYVFSLCNRLYRLLEDSQATKDLNSIRELFKNVMNGFAALGIQLQSKEDDKPRKLRPQDMIDLWFNGEYFHSDADKMPQLRSMRKNLGPAIEFAFLDAIRNVSQCAFCLADFIRKTLILPDELRG